MSLALSIPLTGALLFKPRRSAGLWLTETISHRLLLCSVAPLYKLYLCLATTALAVHLIATQQHQQLAVNPS